MKDIENKFRILRTLKVFVLALVLTVGLHYVSAQTWSAPTSAPPAGNTYAPLNVSSLGQVKDGGLTLGHTLSNDPAGCSGGPCNGLYVEHGRILVGSSASASLNPLNPVGHTLKLWAGNGGTNIGSLTNSPLLLNVNDSERVRIATNGYVGIGLGGLSPSSKLTIQAGKIKFTGAAADYSSTYRDGIEGWGGAKLYSGTYGDTFHIMSSSTGNPATNILCADNVPDNGNGCGDSVFIVHQDGKLTIKGGSPSDGKFLKSTNDSGDAVWATAPASDISLKKNIKPLGSDTLDKVLRLKGVSFEWKDPTDVQSKIGFIAQDVEKVFPEVVHVEDDGLKSVDYQKLVAPLVEAIKSQQAQIEQLKAEVEVLKNK